MTPFIVDLAVKGTLLLVLAFGAALLLRRSSAAARHLHWQLALGALLALPLLATVTPRVAVPAGPLSAWLARDAAQPEASSVARHDVPRHVLHSEPAEDARRSGDGPSEETVRESAPSVASAPPASAPARLAGKDRAPTSSIFTFRFALTPTQRLLAAWAAGAAAVLALLALGLLRALALSRRATPVTDPAWIATADRARRELRLTRRIELRRVPDAVVPMTFGWLRPVVLLPADSDRWSPSRRRHVLLHELAHVRRGDWLGQLAAQVACAAWWWQPLTWIAARELRRHRELACDDAVLVAGNRASEYADDLLAIAASRSGGPSTGAATLAMARRGQLEGRLLAVLENGRRRAGPTPRRALLAAAGTAALVTALACVQPKPAPSAPQGAGSPDASLEITGTVTDAQGRVVPEAQLTLPERNLNSPAPRARRAPMVPRVPQTAPAPPSAEAPPELPSPSATLNVAPLAVPRLRFNMQPIVAPITVSMPSLRLNLDSLRGLGYVGCDDGSTSIWSWSDGDDHWSVVMQGCVSPNDEVTSIGWVDEDASFLIEHTHGDATDHMEARGSEDDEGNDTVAWTWHVGGQELSGDAARTAADKLLATAMTRTGLFASQRVQSLVAHGSPAKALEAIRAMPEGGGRDDMLRCLLTEHELESADFAAALALAAEGDSPDSALADIIGSLGPEALSDPDLVEPLFKAVETIESDSAEAEVLGCLLNGDYVDSPVAARALRAAAAGIESDSCAAEFLGCVQAGRLRDPAVREAWVSLFGTIESDSEAVDALGRLLGERGIKGETLATLLAAAARDVDSDACMAELLSCLPTRASTDSAAQAALLKALASIESDSAQSEALQRLLDGASPQAAAVLLPAATAGVDSDSCMAELLESLPTDMLKDPAARSAFDAALATIQSNGLRHEVMEAHDLLVKT